MNPLQVLFVPNEITYTGEQLRSHWAYMSYDLLGDSAVAFIGACRIQPEHMKDLEDVKALSRIHSEGMVHFIVEHFGLGLDQGVLRQHLLVALMAEDLNRRLGEPRVRREGSDLYDGRYKLTISIASLSPVSTLIHAAINVTSRGTPVPTRGLEDFGIAPREFADQVLSAYARECAIIQRACLKVRTCE